MTTNNLKNMPYLNENVNFSLNADFFMVPTYRISPFRTESISLNSHIKEEEVDLLKLLCARFNYDFEGIITSGGRESIELCLQDLDLRKNDKISIVTPSKNKYISGCVTKSIEKYCTWNREITSKTKVIFVIHEFGKVYENMDEIYSYGLPVIEDYAHAFLSKPQHQIKSDYIIYSFPKSIPIQYGGALFAKKKINSSLKDKLSENRKSYINKTVYFHMKNIDKKISLQKGNYNSLKDMFHRIGLDTYFEYKNNETPSVFMFSYDGLIKDGDYSLKDYLQSNGVECSFFYGAPAFFIPVNYSMSDIELEHLYHLVLGFFANGELNDNK